MLYTHLSNVYTENSSKEVLALQVITVLEAE